MVIQKMLFKLHVYLPSSSFLEHQMQYHSPPFKGSGTEQWMPSSIVTRTHSLCPHSSLLWGGNCGSERGSTRSTKFYMDYSRSQKLSASWSWESLPCHHLSAIISCLLLSPFLRPLTTAIISLKGLLPPSKHPRVLQLPSCNMNTSFFILVIPLWTHSGLSISLCGYTCIVTEIKRFLFFYAELCIKWKCILIIKTTPLYC